MLKDDDDDTVTECPMVITFGGECWQVPGPGSFGLSELYDRWQAEGGVGSFEIRDPAGKLLAIGLRRRGPMLPIDLDD